MNDPKKASSKPRGIPGGRGRPSLRRETWPPPELIALGKVVRPHGIRGEVRIYPFTRLPEEIMERCPDAVLLWTEHEGARPFTIESMSVHQNILIVALEGIETRNDAESVRDAFLCIREEERWGLQDDEFYVDDLVGMEIRDADSGEVLGSVVRVTDGAAHDYLEIRRPEKEKTCLIPFIRTFVIRVNAEEKTIDVRLPEGLLDVDQLPE